MNTTTWTLPIQTASGEFIASFSSRGLKQLQFPAATHHQSQPCGDPMPAQVQKWAEQTEQALKSVLSGRSPDELPPLDWTGATEFQQQVWRALLRIPCGKTCTYGELANEIGSPNATRAVGSACGANPIPVLVPCHRVLASGGSIGGFSGGLDWKRRLLKGEQTSAPFELKG
jgi:methylated-DNA-[protein]-cysteine S-methyltransferase